MHVAIITAGGAGMFCGSCMHDNTWARSLMQAGAEVTLVPTYTPIRVDEHNNSIGRVFLGGINVYLDHQWRWWSKLPNWLTGWLNHPWLIRLATMGAVSNDASQLGELTLAMLNGETGPQHREMRELAEFLATDLKPDIVCFSNALLVGALRTLKEHYQGQVYCTLQGDDIFLDGLPPRLRSTVINRLSERAAEFDGFLVHSQYYRDFMAKLLHLPVEKFHQLPLGIDLTGHTGLAEKLSSDTTTIGYFARVCPEKGLHLLVDAMLKLEARHPQVKLVAGGYCGGRDQAYLKQVQNTAKPLGDRFSYVGSPKDVAAKVALLSTFDIFSVPTTYREPKGLSVLEALANGIPVVQPDHGTFPEMIANTKGGLLFRAGQADDLASKLEELIVNRERRLEFGRRGQSAVRQRFSAEAMARATIDLFTPP